MPDRHWTEEDLGFNPGLTEDIRMFARDLSRDKISAL